MSDSTEHSPQQAGASRRNLLKGAVGAGVGLAAWSAPKIGTIPAYALTNSSGVFDGVCYYVMWASGNPQEWRRGPAGPPGRPLAPVITGTVTDPGFQGVYTWPDVFGPGQDLEITITGTPQPHDPNRNAGGGSQHNQRLHGTGPDVPYPSGGVANLQITGAPADCGFDSTDHVFTQTYSEAPAMGCATPGTAPSSGWSSTGITATASFSITGFKTATLTDVRDGSGPNYAIFNIVCN